MQERCQSRDLVNSHHTKQKHSHEDAEQVHEQCVHCCFVLRLQYVRVHGLPMRRVQRDASELQQGQHSPRVPLPVVALHVVEQLPEQLDRWQKIGQNAHRLRAH